VLLLVVVGHDIGDLGGRIGIVKKCVEKKRLKSAFCLFVVDIGP